MVQIGVGAMKARSLITGVWVVPALVLGLAAIPVGFAGAQSSVAVVSAGSGVAKGTISLTGEALVRVAPDRITMSFGLERTGDSVPEISRQIADDGRNLISVLEKAGVPTKHIQTEDLQLGIEYKDSGRPSSGIKAFTASRSYSVRLTTTTLVEPVMTAALTDGRALTMAGPSYGVENLRPLRDQARKMAIKAAREKAELLAAEMGRKVGAATSINEGWNNFVTGARPYAGRGGYYGQMNTQNVVQNVGGEPGTGGDDGLPLGQVGVSASVNMTFELL
jgi:uncharacterized protein YggE